MPVDSVLSALLSSGVAPALLDVAEFTAKNPISILADAKQVVTHGDELLKLAVAIARQRGESWESIGHTLGVTRSTAHGRFSSNDLEALPLDTLEREFAARWGEVVTLGEKVRRPFTHSAGHLDPGARKQLQDNLLRVANDRTESSAARLRAAELVVALEPESGERALRGLKDSYTRTPATDEPAESRLHRLLAQLAPPKPAPAPEADFLVSGYETVVEESTPGGKEFRRAAPKLAAALVLRGGEKDLTRAIDLFHAVQSEATVLPLATAFLNRFDLTGDHRDLGHARGMLLDEVRSPFDRGPDFSTLLQRLAQGCAQQEDWSVCTRALEDALRTAERIPDSRTRTIHVVRTRLQLACAGAARNDYSSAVAHVQSARRETVNLPPEHELIIRALQVHIAILLETDRAEAVRRLEELHDRIRGRAERTEHGEG